MKNNQLIGKIAGMMELKHTGSNAHRPIGSKAQLLQGSLAHLLKGLLAHGLICSLALILTGCTRNKAVSTVEELEKYVKGPDWPHQQTIIRNGVKVSVRYLPSEALLIPQYKRYEELKKTLTHDSSETFTRRLVGGQRLTDSLLISKRDEIKRTQGLYDQSLYFSMTIGYEDPKRDIEYDKMREGFGEYSQWMQKLVFQMKEYIYLETAATGEVPLALYDMQRTFGITKDRTFLLVFPRKFNEQDIASEQNKEIMLWIKEFGLQTGSINMDFDLPFKQVSYRFYL